MIFPIIIFEKNDSKMHALNYKFLYCDKRYLNTAFKNVEIIDASGNAFVVKRVEKDSSILFFESIKNVGLMVKVKPIIVGEVKLVSLERLKTRVKEHVIKNRKYWSGIDDGRGLEKMIEEAKTYKELALMFC